MIKTIISAENPMFKAAQGCLKFRDSCFEILGFDIILDKSLTPWLLEVNTSPSFATDALIDFSLKSKVLTEALNIITVQKDTLEHKINDLKLNGKTEAFLPASSVDWKSKSKVSKQLEGTELKKHKRRMLVNELTEELRRSELFKLIFPAHNVDLYSRYLEEERPLNVILRNEIARMVTGV